jgi:hypothetical protein
MFECSPKNIALNVGAMHFTRRSRPKGSDLLRIATFNNFTIRQGLEIQMLISLPSERRF